MDPATILIKLASMYHIPEPQQGDDVEGAEENIKTDEEHKLSAFSSVGFEACSPSAVLRENTTPSRHNLSHPGGPDMTGGPGRSLVRASHSGSPTGVAVED